ncbi:aldo/keto reductase [Saccharothrix sp. AJ9571]|nr:aldo/keto reductase [Saccharothrix sp. AJ9571]
MTGNPVLTAAPRPFGRLPVRVSPLGLGTYHLTADRLVPHDEALRLVRAAADAGITLYDTAPMYGLGEAEAILAEALGTRLGEQVVIDKIGRFEKSIVARLGDRGYREPAVMLAQFEHSLRVLGLERLPVLLLHESDWDQWWDDTPGGLSGPVLDLVAQLRSRGLVGGVGLSVRKPERAEQLIRSGLFDAMLFVHYYNIVWQEAGQSAIRTAAEHDLGIAIGAPYRQGLLTSTDPALLDQLTAERRSSVPPGVIERIGACQDIARGAGLSMPELGLRWLLDDRRVHSVVVGPRSVAELAENVRWAGTGPLPAEVTAELGKITDIPVGAW